MRRLALLLCALAIPEAAGAAELRTIPASFQGQWSLTVEQCTPGRLDDANVRVGARLFQDLQTKMDVRTVSVQGKDEIIVGGRVGTGADRYDNVKRLALLDNGATLGVGEGEDHSLYVRCKP